MCPRNPIPRIGVVAPGWHSWTRRHCLRAADSSVLLPSLYIYSDGRDLIAESHPDRSDSLPNFPGEFLCDEAEVIDGRATESALSTFIDQTFDRIEGVDGDRATRAVEQWHAIRNADEEEAGYCKLVGRMGLDPYDPEEISDHLAAFFEAMLDEDDPLARDLTEVAKPDAVEAQWRWVMDVSRDFALGPRSIDPPFAPPARTGSPAEYGYDFARRVRAYADQMDAPIQSVEAIARIAVRSPFNAVDRSHVPGRGIKAVVGQSAAGEFLVVGPEAPGHCSRRFKDARSLYHAIATTSPSQRLVTDAYSSDQKASRAFAAELLAPRDALLDRLAGSVAGPEAIDRLSREFQVSPLVVQMQLKNAGVEISLD
ncbi:MAG: hypothetical protein BGO49_17695 [Planctomycetales bacterium 71-10]|nr:MAG: hypothetical protein BGO49_17695 [Planctomycetales bacterium 71-10]